MVSVSLIAFDGHEYTVTASSGDSLMAAARAAGIPGIIADCGGTCSCATCHVIIDKSWSAAVGAPSPFEDEMLELAVGRTPTSRLSCQIILTDALDGLVAHIPEKQL